MILGVDHVALSCEDIHDASAILQTAGFRVRFVAEGVPNRPAKQPFLRQYRPVHAVAYCEADVGIAVELTAHGTLLRAASSAYQILLPAPPPGTSRCSAASLPWAAVWQQVFGCRRPVAAVWDALQAPFWCDDAAVMPAMGVRAILLPVRDASRAEAFWCAALGCRSVARGTTEAGCQWVHLAFRAPVPQWSLDLIVAEGPGTDRPLLDEPGFPCLALLSTAASRDAARIASMGAPDVSAEFQVEVNGRSLRIVVMRGPEGELVELIEV